MKPKYRNLFFAATAMLAVSYAHAADGTWTRTTGTFNWSDAASWSGGTIADGSGFTADFTTGFTANSTVTLDSSRDIGHIIKGDTNGAVNTLILAASGGSILTLATGGGAPTITNSDLGGGGRMDISAQLSSTQGLTKLGGGNVHLTNAASAWSGNTTVTEGLLHLGAANLANIGGGSGRNISVAAGAAIGINNISNAGLNRIVETAAEFSVLTSSGNQALDFTSATGANLSGAFLGSNLTNGGKTEIQGIITMADNYRLGAVGGYQNGAFGIRQESLLSGTNGLIIGGNRVVIVGTHTFSGDTTLRDGARLGLSGLDADAGAAKNNSSALQNSVLDLGAPSSTGQIFLEAGTAGGIAGLTTVGNGGTTSAAFGGLKGSRDLNSAFLFTGPGNNTSATTALNVSGFTLNTGSGVDVTYSGVIGGFGAGATGATGGSSMLTKTGVGTQVLTGANTYSGGTAVNGGTLRITNSSGLGAAGLNTVHSVNQSGFGATVTPSGAGVTSATLDLNGNISIIAPITLDGTGTGGNKAVLLNSTPGTTVTITNDNSLVSLPFTSAGTNYSLADSVVISGGGGNGATGSINGFSFTGSTITGSGGTGWLTGNTITVNNGGSSDKAVYSVTASGGAITALTLISGGAGYTSLSGLTYTAARGTAGSGSGGTGVAFASNDGTLAISGIKLTDVGSNYTSAPAVSVTTSTGSGFAGGATVNLFTLNGTQNEIGGGTDGDITITSSITGTGGGFSKLGAGKLTLSGTNTYTGATSVNGGTLEIAAGGSTAAGSAVTVSNSGSALVVNGTVNGTLTANSSTTISGTGTIVGNATISGTHNPGNSPGIQTFGADLEYSGGTSVVNWELSDNTITNAANPNAVFDQIVVGGTLNFAGATTLNLLFAGGTVLWADSLWDTDQSWTLYDVTTATTNFSNLSLVSINWLDSGSNLFSTTGGSFALSQLGNDVMINYTIPEPNVAALIGGFGVLALLRRRRR